MSISEQEVRHVAHLARLQLTEAQLRQMTGQLDTILSYVDKLSELDTEGVAPTTHALAASNAFREDRVAPSLPRQEALANAPQHNDESFIVPRVI
ncbi:Asp-tRNA(Asn)/Glu-tRNA(Gln) amidotransferase subunit GatC [Desulfofustis limnaeus]|jgi:aspartyl-tRNA(Asn)/glutamyl-tRNA(Gln) amidotransferase subunit C|uniref:Aspartyl/glutamyl-tRNA(Asn/Gln) amidotransferase subunit C n=1 Tax=Desulfofustis limnaeus TaxID=2740163 RepID=A0ABM7WDN9_9BACT|nr:Asp-tRNA(Asn)/Glu-tRNA(Gln) amidotransferase subunit GatC [Desulfofustis limnaeus]MDX9896209.1 Asp-tRNA(Asn)/Glu-tRNA(Gln) amidotransferase subunit GatC [Desulfofustis sp.]BDD89079.1 aspartyl/glutamyl-tRNA(Asn/Gln) amidotransferase subunit C [Desulfofustis limnaeus]